MSAPRKLYVALLALAGIVLIAGWRIGANDSEEAGASEMKSEPVALTITVASVKREDWVKAVTLSGAVTPWQESVIGAPLSGPRLASIEVEVGDVVSKGQVLAPRSPRLKSPLPPSRWRSRSSAN